MFNLIQQRPFADNLTPKEKDGAAEEKRIAIVFALGALRTPRNLGIPAVFALLFIEKNIKQMLLLKNNTYLCSRVSFCQPNIEQYKKFTMTIIQNIFNKVVRALFFIELMMLMQSCSTITGIFSGIVSLVKWGFIFLVAYLLLYFCVIRPLRQKAKREWAETLPKGERRQIGELPAYYYPADCKLYYADISLGKFTPHIAENIVFDNDLEWNPDYHLLYNQLSGQIMTIIIEGVVKTKCINLSEPKEVFEGHDGSDVRLEEYWTHFKLICEKEGKEKVYIKERVVPYQKPKEILIDHIGDVERVICVEQWAI